MKKFVSLVLALALALSLCTVAMADTSYDYSAASVANASAWNEEKEVTLTVKKVADAVTNTFTEGGKTVKYVVPAKYMIDYKGENVAGTYNGMYFLGTSSSYETVVVNGKTVTYLWKVDTFSAANPNGFKVDEYDTVKTEKKSTGFDLDEDGVCGKYYWEKAATLYTCEDDSGADLYFKASTTAAYATVVDGAVVGLEAVTDVAFKEHSYDYDTKAVGGKQVVTNVFCPDCDKIFAFLQTDDEAEAVKKFGDGNYEQVEEFTNEQNADLPLLFVLTESAKDASTSSTTVDSSKTFDAGVAMYVGLSLMSVAGSAVVIGKKKEF